MQSWKGEKGFDPRFILKNLDVNTLWIFGTNDPAIPVDASLRVLKELANPRFKIEMLRNGNHDFQNTATGTRFDLIPVVRPWLREIGIVD